MSGLTTTIRPIVLACAASSLALTACQPREQQAPPPKPVAQAPAPVAPAPPQPTLSRSDVIAALDAAASDYSAGGAAASASLAGRRFVIRESFGCLGPTTGKETPDGLANWAWAADGKSITISLKPGDWATSPLLGDQAQKLEAAEGIWLARPWLRTEGCPATSGAAADTSTSLSPQTAAVVALFDEGGSRMGRRGGKAYEHRVRGEGDRPATLPVAGYRLVLEGRLGAFSDGGAIRCHADGPDARPVCIAAVQLDRVAFETSDGALLTEWRAG